MTPYPLIFRPVLKQTLWGGRALGDVLNKPIGSDDNYAESWEVVDHGTDQSVVSEGELAGKTLGELVQTRPEWLLGDNWQPGPQPSAAAFPLLLKYLDCNRVLSVQVHPDDEYGLAMTTPDLGKTEAWYIVDSAPDSLLYAGLKSGVGRSDLQSAVEARQTQDVLHAFHPSPGDCVFIPAGTVHALGAGLLVAEIQQSSNTTFRLFDWNRVGADGNPRELHLDQAVAVTDYQRGPISAVRGDANREGLQTMVRSDKFVLQSLLRGVASVAGDGKFRIITVPNGQASIRHNSGELRLLAGESVLLPAAMPTTTVQADADSVVLVMQLP